jgi:hypothetical protein
MIVLRRHLNGDEINGGNYTSFAEPRHPFIRYNCIGTTEDTHRFFAGARAKSPPHCTKNPSGTRNRRVQEE